MDLSKVLSEEWHSLSDKKKEYYEKTYEIRIKQRNEIMNLLNKVQKSKKIPSPYTRFFKKRYAAFSKQFKNEKPSEITKWIA